MRRPWILAGGVALMLAVSLGAPGLLAQARPDYTPAEYNAYTACANDRAAASRVKCLDDFVAKFPESSLMPYANQAYLNAYNGLRNFPKVIEYADKVLSLGDKLELGSRLTALYLRTLAFHSSFNPRAADASSQASKARAAAQDGLQVLEQLPKPEQMTPEQFEQQKLQPKTLFTYTVGYTALELKDYPAAIQNFRAAIALNPADGLTHYRLALAHLQQEPPQYRQGMWELSRAIALKVTGEQQVRNYLKGQLQRYQQTACEREIDAQVSEMIALATASPEPPPDYRVPSGDDLAAARENAAQFLPVLKAGGLQARVMWLAMCNAEFPELYGKVIETADGNDSVILRLFTGTSEEEIEAATAPNTEVKVAQQPEAKRLQKDNWLRYSGTLANYTPDPFVLFFDKAKVNPEDIPDEKATGPAKRPAKRPGKRSGN